MHAIYRSRSHRAAHKRLLDWAMIATVSTTAPWALADSHYWIGLDPGGPWWHSAANWSPAGQPVHGDVAYLNHNSPANAVVWYYNTLYPSAVLNSLWIDGTGAGTIELQINSYNHLLAATDQYIGYSARGYMYQNTGTNSATTMYLGYQPGSGGRYSLTAAGRLSSNLLCVGLGGSGTFLQGGGQHALSADLLLGWNGGSQGHYDMNGGSANVGTNVAVGGNGLGHLQQSGGSFQVGNDLVPGFYADGAGTISLSGAASLSVGNNSIVGRYGAGSFVQSGGTHSIQNNMLLAQWPGSSGVYQLSSGTVIAGGSAYIGGSDNAAGGVGSLLATGGMLDIRGGRMTIWGGGTARVTGGYVAVGAAPPGGLASPGLTIGQAGGAGTVTLHGGLRSSWTFVGWTGGGTFLHQQGFHEVSNYLTLAHLPGSTGYYRLDSGTLSVGSVEVIGFDNNAVALFEQYGGLHTIGELRVADYHPGSRGTFNLRGGTVNTAAAYVGGDALQPYGQGTVSVFDGICNVTGGDLKIWDNGTLNVIGGHVNVLTGTPTSFLLIPGVLAVGGSTGPGTLTLRGHLSAQSGFVGYEGVGTLIQQKGMHQTGNLSVGWQTGGGFYRLDSGTLAVVNAERIGYIGSGTVLFEQLGGLHSVGGTFGVAGVGRYALNGGTLTAPTAYLGGDQTQPFGRGTLTVGGGAVSFGRLTAWTDGAMYYNAGTASVGTLAMQGGKVVLSAGGDKVLQARAVSFAGGWIDIADNGMTVDYTGVTPLATIRSYILTGYAGGSWTGDGITSTVAAHVPGRGIGYAEAVSLYTTFPGVFMGQTVDSTSVLLRYTLYGDANLDGAVNIADFARLAASFNQSSTWADGDFNYDGTTGIGDFSLLASHFNQGLPAGETNDGAAVPDPAGAIGLIILGMGQPLRARRPRRAALSSR